MAGDAFRRNPFVGFGCGGYRSFSGPEPARIGPFDRVQVIAGQNNCGKSALIDYLIKVVGAISEHGVIRKEDNPLTQEDYPLKGIDLQCSPTISFCVDIEALKE